MALRPQDVPVSRRDLYDWVEEARGQKVNRAAHVRAKLEEQGLTDERLLIAGEEVDLCDYIVSLLDEF
jgi:hypothetical protein